MNGHGADFPLLYAIALSEYPQSEHEGACNTRYSKMREAALALMEPGGPLHGMSKQDLSLEDLQMAQAKAGSSGHKRNAEAANIGAITGSGDDQDKNGTEVHTIADSDEEPASPTQSLSGLRDQLQTGTGDSRVRRRLQQAEPDMQPDEGNTTGSTTVTRNVEQFTPEQLLSMALSSSKPVDEIAELLHGAEELRDELRVKGTDAINTKIAFVDDAQAARSIILEKLTGLQHELAAVLTDEPQEQLMGTVNEHIEAIRAEVKSKAKQVLQSDKLKNMTKKVANLERSRLEAEQRVGVLKNALQMAKDALAKRQALPAEKDTVDDPSTESEQVPAPQHGKDSVSQDSLSPEAHHEHDKVTVHQDDDTGMTQDEDDQQQKNYVQQRKGFMRFWLTAA